MVSLPWAALNFWLLADRRVPAHVLVWMLLLILEDAVGDRPADLGPGRSDVRHAPQARQMILRLWSVSLPALFLAQFIVRGLLLLPCLSVYASTV